NVLLLTVTRCPEDAEDWHYFNGWCYSLSEAAEGWFGSEKACQKLGGHLASIASREENSFVQALGQCEQNAWIGLVKTDVSDRKFSWWDDAPFNYTERFSININAYYDCCPEGWLAIEGSCFYVSSKRTNYFNAQISCESMGATVASVSSRREQVLLTMALGCDSRIWIGLEKVKPCLSDSSKSYCYMWMDGSEIGYADWASGHPSSSNEIECTYTLGRWYTTNCYNEYNFVCKKK
uniref:C-type lectin domain-containing protein n=1 Tax=Macrostomum lignano TaxID=282301 RepID=A0A1I8H510_9PLAT